MAMTFMAAARKYFGFKEGQTLTEFSKEVKELTAEDRAEMAEGLSKELGELVNP